MLIPWHQQCIDRNSSSAGPMLFPNATAAPSGTANNLSRHLLCPLAVRLDSGSMLPDLQFNTVEGRLSRITGTPLSCAGIVQHFAGLESFLTCYTCRVTRECHCRRGSGRTGGGAADWCLDPLWLHAREKEAIQLERRATESPAKNGQCSSDVGQLSRSGEVSCSECVPKTLRHLPHLSSNIELQVCSNFQMHAKISQARGEGKQWISIANLCRKIHFPFFPGGHLEHLILTQIIALPSSLHLLHLCKRSPIFCISPTLKRSAMLMSKIPPLRNDAGENRKAYRLLCQHRCPVPDAQNAVRQCTSSHHSPE